MNSGGFGTMKRVAATGDAHDPGSRRDDNSITINISTGFGRALNPRGSKSCPVALAQESDL
jgi:hypothetical protein